ncbi:MAG: ABC transporter ATP-binding protein [Caldilineaceae bacterium]|nr:ABC transporter ATP-binding protein [Caldilineaceae bacterium]
MGFLREGLTQEGYDRDYTTRELMQRIGSYFRPSWVRLSVIMVLVALIALMGAAVPILVARGVEQMELGAGATRATAILVGVVLAIGVLTWLANWGRRLQTSILIGDVLYQMRADAFAATMGHDMSFFDRHQSGRIVSRITSDTDEFGRVAVLITELFSQILLVLILFVYLANIDLRLTLVLVCLVPVPFIIGRRFQNVARRVTRKSQQAIADVNASIQEAVTGISVAKNFRREAGIYGEFEDVNSRSYDIHVKRGLVLAMLFPTLQFFAGLGTAVLLYVGGMSTYAAVITAGAWFLFMNSVQQFWFPMINLSAFWSQFQSALSATERVFALIDAQPEVHQREHNHVPRLRGDIKFRDVDFRYNEKEQVLLDFNLHIRPGESVALVGHTGAGKSSLGKLVARFYEFQEGDLLIDGRDIRSFDLPSYRRRMGIVPQAPFLFSGTVADNIRYAKADATDAEVRAVASRIGGGDWLDALENGLDTDVGEEGRAISMGQRQLVAMARVLIQDPAIIILDEATASVDPLTEAQIQEGLDEVLRDRTAIVIAHRLSTIRAADRIIVLEKGRIIEEGDHDALMARGGHYADLYNTYFRHQSPDYDPAFVPAAA